MGNQQNFIEINGQRYDAVTGALMGNHGALKSVQKPVVDGFIKRPKHATTIPVPRGGSLSPTSAQHAKTLMRSAVKKPTTVAAKTAISSQKSAKPIQRAIVTPRTAATSPYREHRAQQVKKSELVHKFGAPQMPAESIKKIAPLEVRPAPASAPSISVAATQKEKTADLLDRALEAAQSHNEPFYNPKKPIHKRIAKKLGISGKVLAISTTVLAGLLIGSFYAYQNVPNLAMRVAAARAGFSAAMPGYSPSGFAFQGPVQYSAGQVIVSFRSNGDASRNYKLTQQTSTWTSDTLLSNFVAVGGKEYQTYQDRGRTIYIYDGSNATWVNGGIWYQIEGNSDLTSAQLVRIAASL